MKRSFRIGKVVLAYLVIGYFFVSCSEKNYFHGKHMNFKAGKKLKGDIHIVDYSSTDGSLTLYDDDYNNAIYAQVARNQKIKWVIDTDDNPDMDNFQIDSIYADPDFPNTTDFFSTLPSRDGNHWAAIISDDTHLDPKRGFLEKYTIVWQLKGNTKTYSCDPLMQINPK